jgi:WW domain
VPARHNKRQSVVKISWWNGFVYIFRSMEDKIEKLPKNWVKKQSKSRPDKFYYFNTTTGVSSWSLPKGENNKNVTSPKKEGLRGISSQSSEY